MSSPKNDPHQSLFSHLMLTPPPALTSFDRPWEGAVINWHEWKSGGKAASPELDHDTVAVRTSGTVRLSQVRDGKTHTATVTVGNVTVHPKGMESRLEWDLPGSALLMRLPPALLQQAAEATILAPLPKTELQNCFERRDTMIERIARHFLDELRAPPHPAQAYISQSLSQALAVHLVHRFNVKKSIQDKLPSALHPRSLQRIKDYINTHLHEHIDLQTLAAIANVSRFYFSRMFKQSTGISAMSYLERARMRRAQELIQQGNLPLGHIAQLVGYEDQSHFSRRFRLVIGLTPTAYACEAGLVQMLD